MPDRPTAPPSPVPAPVLLVSTDAGTLASAAAALHVRDRAATVLPATALAHFAAPVAAEALAQWVDTPESSPADGALSACLLAPGTAVPGGDAPPSGLLAEADGYERLGTESARCARYGRTLVLALIEPDELGWLVQRFGSRAGVREQHDLGAWLAQRLRRTDLVACHGTARCLVVLTETPLEGGRTVIERLRIEYLQRRQREGGAGYLLGFSAGLVETHGRAGAAQLLTAAAGALAQAQAAGGDCARIAVSPEAPGSEG